MPIDYLAVIDRLLIKERSVLKESDRHYKVYLPKEFTDIWKKLYVEKEPINVIVLWDGKIEGVDKVLMTNRHIARQGSKYKLYFPRKYNSVWEKLWREGKKVDLLIVLR